MSLKNLFYKEQLKGICRITVFETVGGYYKIKAVTVKEKITIAQTIKSNKKEAMETFNHYISCIKGQVF